MTAPSCGPNPAAAVAGCSRTRLAAPPTRAVFMLAANDKFAGCRPRRTADSVEDRCDHRRQDGFGDLSPELPRSLPRHDSQVVHSIANQGCGEVRQPPGSRPKGTPCTGVRTPSARRSYDAGGPARDVDLARPRQRSGDADRTLLPDSRAKALGRRCDARCKFQPCGCLTRAAAPRGAAQGHRPRMGRRKAWSARFIAPIPASGTWALGVAPPRRRESP